MNNSKLFQFLVDNDCPFEWEVIDNASVSIFDESCTIKFFSKKEKKNVNS